MGLDKACGKMTASYNILRYCYLDREQQQWVDNLLNSGYLVTIIVRVMFQVYQENADL